MLFSLTQKKDEKKEKMGTVNEEKASLHLFTSSPLHPFRTLWKRRGHRSPLRDPRMTTASSQFEVREVFTKPRPFSREPSAVSTFHPEFLKDSEFFSPLSGTG